MTAAGADAVDPVQARVEDAIRRIAFDIVGLPCQIGRAAADRVTRPWVLARSLISLTAGGLVRRALPPRRGAPAPGVRGGPPAAGRTAPAGAATPTRGLAGGPPPADLPIAGYESLAASQVVARLDRLDAADLRRVAAFETAHRGRRTVLGKIEHLLASGSR